MSFAVPDFSRKAITRAGATLIDEGAPTQAKAEALALINHWRACHAYPVNTFRQHFAPASSATACPSWLLPA